MTMRRVLITGGSGFIGTNLIDLLEMEDVEILNLDIMPPLSSRHIKYWNQLDFLDKEALRAAFESFRPDCVVDFAARTDVDQSVTVESGYQLNIDGVANIIDIVKSSPFVTNVVFTSSQYVKRPGRLPASDEDYDPHTIYGESKVRMEKLIRRSALKCTWTIIRPTNVWGPWHLRYRKQFFRVLSLGLYLHPDSGCVKSYAFVGNVVNQIFQIFMAPSDVVNRQTFYVGDAPAPLILWVNAFSVALTGAKVRVIPAHILRIFAKLGDIISIVIRRPFLITTSRYNSMVENYPTPMEKTFHALGKPPYSLSEGVSRTVFWLNEYDNKAM